MNPFRRKNDQIATSVVLDTSGLIDGRIVQIAKAGFIPQNVVVPQFVIAELQFLADHGDTHKRERARYGLDVIRELQEERRIEVSISREKFNNIKEVDDKLVALAKQYGAYLYTTDFNLNKVAQIEGIAVLNVNELAHALRPNLLPGEQVSIKLTQVGQDKTQGVGYLGDGTMVVVEQASRFVGQTVQANCTRILQTQAGKMMFATLASKPQQVAHFEPKPQPKETPMQPQPKQQPVVRAADKPQQANGGQVLQAQAKAQRRRHDQPKHRGGGNGQPQQQQSQPAQPQKVRQQQPAAKKNNNTATPAQKQAESPAKPAPQSNANKRGGRGQKRRFSPEDSLIATLKEIQQ